MNTYNFLLQTTHVYSLPNLEINTPDAFDFTGNVLPVTTRIKDTFASKGVTVITGRSFDEVAARLYPSIRTAADAG
ncbi:hypothetical protein J3F84DRAFT_376431 [Trichoderma pleuroticola]